MTKYTKEEVRRMSEFSEKIRVAIKNSKLTMPYLSEMSGLSVPNLYKICQGKRLPKEKERIIALIKALQCPKSEENALIKKYQIEVLGREEYYCLESIQELLPRIGQKSSVGMYFVGESTHPDVDVLCGKVDCSRYLQQVLMEEVRKNENGMVKIIGGEECSYLMECIPVVFQNSRTTCQHILRLDSRNLPESDLKNVKLVSSVLPAAFSGFSYQPYYYYEYGRVKNNKIQLFHSAIILPDQVIMITDNYDKAVILKQKDQIALMEEIFTHLLEESISMIRYVEGMNNWQKLIGKLENENRKKPLYVLEKSIGVLSVLNEEMLRKHIEIQTPEMESVFEELLARNEQSQKDQTVRFGTKSGLLDFVQNGKLEYVPENLYTPLTLEERIWVLEQLRGRWQEGQKYYLLNENKFSVSDCLFVETYSESDGLIGYFERQEKFYAYLLNEKGIASWVYRFLHYMEDSDLVLTHEETIAFVDEMIAKMKQKL